MNYLYQLHKGHTSKNIRTKQFVNTQYIGCPILVFNNQFQIPIISWHSLQYIYRHNIFGLYLGQYDA